MKIPSLAIWTARPAAARNALQWALCLLTVVMLAGCSYRNHLPPGEKLYLGADVKPESDETVRARKHLRREAERVVRPEPNSKFLGMRIRLGIHNAVKEPKKKRGFKHWLKYKVGEPPVLYSQVEPYRITQLMDARLFNHGVFDAITSYELKQNEHSVKVIYKPRIHRPYRIDSLYWPTDDDDLNAGLREGADNTMIKLGRDYNLDVLIDERDRLDSLLKNRGFFYFSPDYIQFDADTTLGDKRMALHIRLKDDIPYAAALVYRISDVFVYPDYSITNDTLPRADTVRVVHQDKNYTYVSRFGAYRPTTIVRAVFVRPDELYSRRRHEMTLNRVMGLGIFKYANIRYLDVDTAMPGFLDAHVFLSPLPRKSARVEADAVHKSNNYVGPQLNLVFRNRNTMRGAESLVLTFRGTYETQIAGPTRGLTSYSFGPQIEYIVPRMTMMPVRLNMSSFYQPRTRYQLGYEYVRRAEYFSLNSVTGAFGYQWRQSRAHEHEFNPIDLNYVRLSNLTTKFENLLAENPLLRRSYQEQFIAGLSYTFTYNEQVYPRRVNQFFFRGNLQTSGNALSLVALVTGREPNPADPIRIARAPFAQFARTEFDARNYYNFQYGSRLVARAYAGIGLPYGNSDRLPYIRQFFAGGPNSVRAFHVRSLGPGAYRAENDAGVIDVFAERGGDIKLESNLEYRFDIYSIFKGAVFVDAGNTWLVRGDSLQPDGEFEFNRFYKELGIGGGLGVRVDANFFVLRLDVAMPVRKPWYPHGGRWVLNEIDFGNSRWRRDNIVLNIAIGYPF